MSCLSCKENCISCESVDNTVICLSCGAGFTLKDKTCNQILLYLRIDKVIDNVIYFTVFNLNWMILQNLNIGLSIDGNVITVFNVLPSTGGRLL